LSEDYIPLEAGLKWAISLNKGCYVGQEIIALMETHQKLAKRLVVLGGSIMSMLKSKDVSGDHLLNIPLAVGAEVREGGSLVGHVTSVAPLIVRGMARALAYVKTAVAEPGRALYVISGDEEVAMTVMAVPGKGM
jgi:folate-binding protein YgfZ